MTTASVAVGRGHRVLGASIAALGIVVVLSPYVWLAAWRGGGGFSTQYLPFHLWGWAPFLTLALVASALNRRAGVALCAVLVATTVASVLLTQSLDVSDQELGIALPGLLTFGVIGAWGLSTRRPGTRAAGVFALVIAAIAAGRVISVGDLDRVQTFLVIGTSIAVEALPFVLLGAAVSAAIEVFVPDRWFAAIARLPLP
jgi:hypothetical protein